MVVRLAKWLESMTTDQEVGGFISPKVLLDESFQLNIKLPRDIQQGPGGLVDMHGLLSPDPSGSNLSGGSIPHAEFLACKM